MVLTMEKFYSHELSNSEPASELLERIKVCRRLTLSVPFVYLGTTHINYLVMVPTGTAQRGSAIF